MLISDLDFVRREISSVLNNHWPASFPILEKTDFQNGSYYSLPVFKGFVFNLGEPGEIPRRKNVYFPTVFFETGINFNLAKPELLASKIEPDGKYFNYTFGFGYGPLINFAYIQYPGTIPWEAVQVSNGQDTSTLIYTALLDRTLEFFASGKTDEAINGLDSAIAVVPKQNLEGARLAALKYLSIRLSFWQNVGELQSLPPLHNAYELFLQSKNDPRFSEKDPLTNWLRDILESGYENWDWTTMFFDRTSILKAIPHIEDDVAGQNRYTDVLERDFRGKSYEEMLKMLQMINYSTAELHFIKYIIIGKFIQQTIGGIIANNTNSNFTLSKSAEEVKRVIPLLQFINSALLKKHELRSDSFSVNALDFFEYLGKEIPKMPNIASDDETLKFIYSRAKDNLIMGNIANFFKVVISENKSLTNGSLNDIKFQWWEKEYLVWFLDWSVNAVRDINTHDYPWANFEPPHFSVRELISKYGNDRFTKDMDGRGRTFLPGLFFLAWYEQTFDIDGADELKKQFEAETKMPFDLYRSKLFPPKQDSTEPLLHSVCHS